MVRPLYIEPSDKLEFAGSFKRPITRQVRVKNWTGKRMSYKLKSSSNTHIKIRPWAGFLKNKETTVVEVTFLSREPPPAPVADGEVAPEVDPVPRDAYHISLYEADARDDTLSLRDIWRSEAAKNRPRKKKVKCVFRLADDPQPNGDLAQHLDPAAAPAAPAQAAV